MPFGAFYGMKDNYTDNTADNFEEYAKGLASKDLKWIGVDFDNVMSKSIWPKAGIGPAMPGASKALHALVEKGFKIMIWTARPWSDYENIERWCRDHDMPVRRIFCGKPLVRWFVDDKNIEFDYSNPTEWETVISKIK